MARTLVSTAILLRNTRLTDSSLISHWLTPEHGLLKSVAKGARRPHSALAGRLDLFFEGTASFQLPARGGELFFLRDFAVSHWREGMRRDYLTPLLGSYFCQLCERALVPGQAEGALFDLLHRALDHLDREPPSWRALRHFERELLRLLGVSREGAPAEDGLRDWLGSLPASRHELEQRLPADRALGSSSATDSP